jgi:SSS family solute:Na+ symporter
VVALVLGYFVPPFSTLASNIHRFHFLGLVFACLVGLMIAVGAVRPRATAWVQTETRSVDMTPWRLAVPVSMAILVVVVAIYAAFADFSAL